MTKPLDATIVFDDSSELTLLEDTVQLGSSSFYQIRLSLIGKLLEDVDRLDQVILDIERETLSLLTAGAMTIYRALPEQEQLKVLYHTGRVESDEGVAISPETVIGYVAQTRKVVCIPDVFDVGFLRQIHHDLKWDADQDIASESPTKSLIAAPIAYKGDLLGVLQVTNKKPPRTFSEEDNLAVATIAVLLGQAFYADLKQSEPTPLDLLVDEGLIRANHLEEYRQRAANYDVPVTFLLQAEADIPAADLGRALQNFYNVPFMGYDPEYELMPMAKGPERVKFFLREQWIPIVGPDGDIVILAQQPQDSSYLMDAERILDHQAYTVCVALPEDILRYLGIDLQTPAEVEEEQQQLSSLLNQLNRESIKLEGGSEDDDSELLDENESSIIQIVNMLIVEAVKQRASDIHIQPSAGHEPTVVRLRVDGVCRPVLELPSTHTRAVIGRVKVISGLDIAKRHEPQDGKIRVTLGGEPLEIRVAVLPTVNGEYAVLRLLARGKPLPLSELYLSERNLTLIERGLEHPHGIILAVGPTGSGKTTTLHALVASLNTPGRNILTVEDPVEITQPGLQQVQVHPRIGLTFSTVLRSFLRADPDVILVGEMRDYETAHIALESSLTGHLVLSTLHTNSAAQTITRLLDMGLDPLNFADAAILIVAQRLVRCLCPDCHEVYVPQQAEIDHLIRDYGEEMWGELAHYTEELRLRRPAGCDHCGQVGYKGRMALHEVMYINSDLREAITSRRPAGEIHRLAIEDGMRTLRQDGIAKVLAGHTDLTELRRATTTLA